MSKLDFMSVMVTIIIIVIDIFLINAVVIEKTHTEPSFQLLLSAVSVLAVVMILGCIAKYFGFTKSDLESLK